MSYHAQASQYRQTAVSSAVLDADPHRLVALMFAGLRERLQLAAACIDARNVARKGQAISEASQIIGHLAGSLNLEAGGEIAQNLLALYDYIQRRVLEANVHNDTAALHECDALVGDIQSAWNAIAPHAPEAARMAAGASA
ncbi:flagellar export chaperone FliS [Cognatilysobacter lacus]|uniref:Flagellar secretion chaperone FliS n=1 Tax=Cognatilysobacter lacus TaxID=1643323 RepID=A0A5D8YX63_9GAMM|nr:flagellar export chaperone FliS [Lysobacter lacus]TZF87308.1 flagellar export chaperone FliS [Lysobacter lacus]